MRNSVIRGIVALGLVWAALTPAFGQSKLDTRVERTLSEIGNARVLVVMTAPKLGEAPSIAYSEPAGFVDDLLGDRGRNVRRIVDLPVVVVETDRRGTHVAGIAVGARVSVDGDAISGVAPGAGLISIQVFTEFDDRSGEQAEPGAGERSSEDVDAAFLAGIAGARRIVVRGGARAATMPAGELAERIASALGLDVTARPLGEGTFVAESRAGFSAESLSRLLVALGPGTGLYRDDPIGPSPVR